MECVASRALNSAASGRLRRGYPFGSRHMRNARAVCGLAPRQRGAFRKRERLMKPAAGGENVLAPIHLPRHLAKRIL